MIGFLSRLFPNLVWKIASEGKKVFITFDDGPHPEVTTEVLAILKEFGAKATFFCVGENVKNFPDTFQKIIKDGHSVGNHTYNHLKGWKIKTPEYIKNIDKASQYIHTNLFRPPYGKIKFFQYAKLAKKYKIIMWTCLSGDFMANRSKEKCLEKVIRCSKPGSVVVFHDSVKTREKALYVLPKYLEYLRNRGYSMEPIIMD